MHTDHRLYFRCTPRSRLDKSINSLLGLIEGIAIDSAINAQELAFLDMWLADHQEVHDLHPFNELVPVVRTAIADGVLTPDERSDLVWLCERLRSTEYFDATTADIQRLHAIVGGIVADTRISADELKGLAEWLEKHTHLRSCWPYDEIDSILTAVMADRQIDEDEYKALSAFFGEFVAIFDGKTIANPLLLEGGTLGGVCVACPTIEFEGAKFCFTGASARYTRSRLVETVLRLGGRVVGSVSPRVKYLVVGAAGNPCWTYACYGRKVEEAVALRKEGIPILIVHENDFHDAVEDSE